MKFSEQWLREYCNPPVTTAELAEQLTMAGLEVDAVDPVAPSFTGVIVGEIRKTQPHSNADKLSLCEINTGSSEAVHVVCGANNVKNGLRVALALEGAELPGDMMIAAAQVRGEDSHGMLCSATELGLAESSDGIMALPLDAPLGQSLRDYLRLDDQSIELDLTPNRGDCLGVFGIAREVAALSGLSAELPEAAAVTPTHTQQFSVAIESPEACPHYVGRVMSAIDAQAQTPVWMQERLRRSGLRPIHPVVDVTNYVMLELGQPMHAFDLDTLSGGIHVRYAGAGESLELLDNQTLRLDNDALVIADSGADTEANAGRAVALAGIMGGLATAVSTKTQNIFLESAFFTPKVMAGKARHYRLHTDSSHRFERGVDFELQTRAIERATALILEICGGEPGPLTDVRNTNHLPQRHPIPLRHARIGQMLGIELSKTQIAEWLQRLGMKLSPRKDGWLVTAPSYRFDIAMEADLVEEVARIYGYDRIPSKKPKGNMVIQALPEAQADITSIREMLIDRGYFEAITYSFVDSKVQSGLHPNAEAIALANPIAKDMDVMRVSLLPGLFEALTYNVHRNQERVRLFEIGRVFARVNGSTVQRMVAGGIACGAVFSEQWGLADQPLDFFDLKNDVEALIQGLSNTVVPIFAPSMQSVLHPGQGAEISIGEQNCGFCGIVHPSVVADRGLKGPIGVFQIELETLHTGPTPVFTPMSKFPSVRRDISIVVKEEISAGRMTEAIQHIAPASLIDFQLFDLYRGESVDPGEKSFTLGLTFQGLSSTLIDSEIDSFVTEVLSGLEIGLGARLRS